MEWSGLNKDARGERLMGGVAAQTWYLSCLLLRLVLVRVDLCVEKCDRDSVRSRARDSGLCVERRTDRLRVPRGEQCDRAFEHVPSVWQQR